MSLSNEIERLARLHQDGQLSNDEFSRAKARLLDGQAAGAGSGAASGAGLGHAINSLQRSRNERWLGGVCGGLSRSSGLAAWIWRLIFIASLPCHGIGLLAYLMLWLLVPEERDRPPQLN